MIHYLMLCGLLLKSLKPLLLSNSNFKFKVKVFSLEIYFLVKFVFIYFFGKKVSMEKFLDLKIYFNNYFEFIFLFIEIFAIQEYHSNCRKKAPVIIDCGSNFGMSIAYFKYFYPNSKITAIEANSELIPLLRKNIKVNKFQNVSLLNAAVSSKSGNTPFYIGENNDFLTIGNSGVKDYSLGSKKIMVEGIKLSSLLAKEVDILKVDIEGMECDVLSQAKNKIYLSREIFVEFHGNIHLPQNSLDKIFDILKKADFSSKVKNNSWLKRESNYILNIHAFSNKYNEKIT